MSRRYASRRYAGGLGPSRIRTRIPTTRQLGQWVSLRKTLRFRVRLQLSQSRCLSLLLAMSGRVFLFLPPRGHEPPPSLRDRLNPNLSLYRHRFPIPRHAKRPDVALYTVGPSIQIGSVHKICRQNLSKIKLCDWPDKLDTTIWQVLSTTESVGWTDSKVTNCFRI